MENEVKKEKVEEKVKEKEIPAPEPENKNPETPPVAEKTETEKETETTEPVKAEENPAPEQKTDETVNETVIETQESGNGIPLSAVAMKADVELMIKEAVASLQSKLDSVVKENDDLKAELEKAKGETENVRKKYEDNGDFGTSQKKGAGLTDEKASSGYVSYDDMWKGANGFTKTGT